MQYKRVHNYREQVEENKNRAGMPNGKENKRNFAMKPQCSERYKPGYRRRGKSRDPVTPPLPRSRHLYADNITHERVFCIRIIAIRHSSRYRKKKKIDILTNFLTWIYFDNTIRKKI